MGGQCHPLTTLPPGERRGAYCTEGWVGPQSLSGWVQKISPLQGFDFQAVQCVASRYTNYTSPSHSSGFWGVVNVNDAPLSLLIHSLKSENILQTLALCVVYTTDF